MLRSLLQVLANSVGLALAAYLLPGIHYEGSFLYLLFCGLVVGLLNLFVKPIVNFFSFPLILLTLGLFYLVTNGLILYLASSILSGLTIDGSGWAILGGIVLGLVNWAVRTLGASDEDEKRVGA